MKLPPGAAKSDFDRCIKILRDYPQCAENRNETALNILNITYSTGGDYSKETLLSIIREYLKRNI